MRPAFFCNCQRRTTCQAQAMWKWSNYLHSKVPVTKKPLHVNIDETSIKIDQDVRHGHVTQAAKKLAGCNILRRRIPKAHTRTAYSLVAVICDDEEIQQSLPQFIVVNSKVCTEAVYKALLENLPTNAVLWRRKSSWMDIGAVCQVVRDVAKSLKKHQTTHQVILSMDACKTHMNHRVWNTAARVGFMMFGIPAKTTGYLQPLDVYAFAQLKNKLRHASQTSCIGVGASFCTLGMSILTLSDVISEVLTGKCWRTAFEHLGHAGHQTSLSKQLLGSLNLDQMPLMAADFPSLADLVHCFPRKYVIDMDAVFKGVLSVTEVKRPVHAVPLVNLVARSSVLNASGGVAGAGSSTDVVPLASSSACAAASSWSPARLSIRRLPSGAMLQPLPAALPPLPPPADPPMPPALQLAAAKVRRTSSAASVT